MSNLFDKYQVYKSDGSRVDPNAQYFVLRIDTDIHAQVAAMAYAQSIERTDPELADELRDRVIAIRKEQEKKYG